jgi:hypothetical protein
VALVYAISAMVAFNVHIVTSLTGALIVPFLLASLSGVTGDRRG